MAAIATLAVLGAVILVASFWARRRNEQVVAAFSRPWGAAWRWRWALGAAMGVGTLFVGYPVAGATPGERYRVFGVPFVVWLLDQNGHDYVWSAGMLLLFLNVATWAMAPHLLLWLLRTRSKAGAVPRAIA